MAVAGEAPRREVDPKLVKLFERFLAAWRKRLVGELRRVRKITSDQAAELLADLPPDERKALMAQIQPYLEDIAVGSASGALADVGMDIKGLLDQANEDAVDWAEERAADLVGMRVLEDDTVIENPNSAWRIDETTRDGIRDLVHQAENEGWSNDRLASELTDSYAFSDSRAEMIARTETAFADVEGNRLGWRASGVVEGQRWLLSENPCPECIENGDAGVIGLDDEFPNGGPPAHPNCECDVVAVVADEGD